MQDRSEITAMLSDFSDRTGLTEGSHPPKRYLWTDAFAVCDYLGLYHQTDDVRFKTKALELVDQVHHLLGRHREDDPRSGWISGLDEQEGALHPTIGGLRIGKRRNERKPDDPYDERLEWEQDGQYFHYLTKWMHALDQVTRTTGDPRYNRWALELAKSAHSSFTYTMNGHKRMYWKMSIDLSHPLVPSMGQHDALDGLICYHQLMATAATDKKSAEAYDLTAEISDMLSISQNIALFTDDPLGIGGLLSDASRLMQLMIGSDLPLDDLLLKMLSDAKAGLDAFILTDTLDYPSEYRLAFRELGLSIGLQAIEMMQVLVNKHPDGLSDLSILGPRLAEFRRYLPISETIETFWLRPEHQKSSTWREHLDINTVMLATSLAPEGYLMLR